MLFATNGTARRRAGGFAESGLTPRRVRGASAGTTVPKVGSEANLSIVRCARGRVTETGLPRYPLLKRPAFEACGNSQQGGAADTLANAMIHLAEP